MQSNTLYYHVFRETAGLTQEDAAYQIDFLLAKDLNAKPHSCSTRTLQAYELGERRAPDKVVEAMVEVYQAPTLAWWHMKKFSPLGKYLPDVAMPKTNGDMAFTSVLAEQITDCIAESMLSVMQDGAITDDEHPQMEQIAENCTESAGMLMSIATHIKQEVLTGKAGSDTIGFYLPIAGRRTA